MVPPLLRYLLLLLSVVLSTAAADAATPQGCRRGTPRALSGVQLHSRRAAVQPQPRQVGGNFYHGDRRQLVVLASFSDRTFRGDEAATMAQWDKIFNADNLSEAPFHGSVHDYFMAQSYGTFRLTFDLQYVALSEAHAKYRSTSADDENSQYLVQDVVSVLQTRNIDWSLYDWNGDGYVNQLLIIFAGKGSSYGYFGGGYDAIWPHQYWMSDHVVSGSSPETHCDPLVVGSGTNSRIVDCYCALQELYTSGGYDSFGTICHEYTHCFGFPDFYVGATSYLYTWELMDYGNNNGGGYCPPCYSAHERWLMGWLTPHELTEAATVTSMPSLSDQPEAYLISNDGWRDEFYMVENRQQKGWDQYLPSSGLVVFHIDYDATVWYGVTNSPNSTTDKRYTIVPANNLSSASDSNIKGWPYPYSDNNALTNTSSPAARLNHANADGTKLLSKPLTAMSVANGLASFDFMGGTSGIQPILAPSDLASGGKLYDLSGRLVTASPRADGPSVSGCPAGIYIIRYANGTSRKVVIK